MKQALSPINICVAEGHSCMRNLLTLALNNYEHQQFIYHIAAVAGSGNCLLETLHNNRQLDICMLDTHIEAPNGYETLLSIRKKWPDLPVLLMSGADADFRINELHKLGVNGYFSKRSELTELINAIAQIHLCGHYYPPRISYKANTGTNGSNTGWVKLTDKELKHLRIFNSNKTYKEIASILCVSERTVQDYRDNLMEKLNVRIRSRESLILLANEWGLPQWSEG